MISRISFGRTGNGFGGMNWGSSSIHEPTDYLVFNDTRSPHRIQLVSREIADNADAASSDEGLSGFVF